MGGVKLARAPVPEGDPRVWLVEEVLKQGATALPCVLTSVQGSERLVAFPEDPDRLTGLGAVPSQDTTDLGSVESAMFRELALTWVGAWGTAVLDRDGHPALVTFVRIRRQDDDVFVAVWPRIPGMAPVAELAEQYEGALADAPRWLKPLFPPLRASQVEFVAWEFAPSGAPSEPEPAPHALEVDPDVTVLPPDYDKGGLPAPDFGQALPEGATFEDALVIAAHRLEQRFVGGHTGPALVAWHDGGISAWFGPDDSAAGALRRLGSRIAYDGRIKGLGLFGLGEDEGVDPPARLIALAMESRAGDRIVWIRRFRMGEGSMATWVDERGFVRKPGPKIGWFDAPEG
jgi:hypothetical protein